MRTMLGGADTERRSSASRYVPDLDWRTMGSGADAETVDREAVAVY